MRCLLVFTVFIASAYARYSSPELAQTIQTVQAMQEKAQQALKFPGFRVQDDTFNAICNGSFFQNLGGLGGFGIDFSGVVGCFSAFCSVVQPGGQCPGLQTFFEAAGEGCPAVSATAVADNCANGCFGKFVAPLQNLGPCIANAFQNIIGQLISGLCGQAPTPEAQAECVAELQSIDFTALAGQFPTNQITDAIDRLCLQNPATGGYCYAILAGGTAQFPGGANPTLAANCPFWASVGCCVTGLKQMLGQFNATSSCGANVSPVSFAQLNTILATCTANGQAVSATNPSLADVPFCPLAGQAVKFVKNTFSLSGFAIGVFNGFTPLQKVAFFQALAIDIGTGVGLTGAQLIYLTVGKFSAGTGANVLVEFTIRGPSDTATDAFGAAVKVFLAGSTVPAFTATIAFNAVGPNAGIIVSGSTVGLDRATSTSTTETQTGASGVAGLSASMMVLFLAMIIAIAFRF